MNPLYLNGPLQDKKAAQEKERESRIAAAEVQNLQGERHQEGLLLAQKLAQQQLQIKEISSDGHCMYRAVEDQLAQRSKVSPRGWSHHKDRCVPSAEAQLLWPTRNS